MEIHRQRILLFYSLKNKTKNKKDLIDYIMTIVMTPLTTYSGLFSITIWVAQAVKMTLLSNTLS